MLRNKLRIMCIALLLPCLSGCGFKLRGCLQVPQYLQTVYITPVDPYEKFQRELRLRLKNANVKVVNHATAGVTTLEIINSDYKEDILAYSSSGQAQRTKISFTVTYKLISKGAIEINESNTVSRSREISLSNNQLLVNESEEQIVRNELLRETVSELLRQVTTRPERKESMLDSSSPADNNPC